MKKPEDFFSSKRGNPCLIIAEIGGNHEGNFKKAKKLAQQALDAGADYVKFQIYGQTSILNLYICFAIAFEPKNKFRVEFIIKFFPLI